MTLPVTSRESFNRDIPKKSCCKRYFPCLYRKKTLHRYQPTRMDSIEMINVKAKETLEEKN
jgi:hypothetical protein